MASTPSVLTVSATTPSPEGMALVAAGGGGEDDEEEEEEDNLSRDLSRVMSKSSGSSRLRIARAKAAAAAASAAAAAAALDLVIAEEEESDASESRSRGSRRLGRATSTSAQLIQAAQDRRRSSPAPTSLPLVKRSSSSHGATRISTLQRHDFPTPKSCPVIPIHS